MLAKRNRIEKKKHKAGLYWCRCDRELISDTTKCELCGRRNGRRRNKKDRGATEWINEFLANPPT